MFSIISFLLFIFWLWMLIDCLKNSHLVGTEKIVWVLVVIFLPVIGSAIYFFVAKRS